MVGKQISELRRQKGVTQETLAQAVGVTPQAVSKWEVGGTPDTELLPVIADYFGVSIDRLFDRKTIDSENIESAIAKYIAETPDEHRFEKAFELCWAIERSLCGNDTLDEHDLINAVRSRDSGYMYSQILNNYGILIWLSVSICHTLC